MFGNFLPTIISGGRRFGEWAIKKLRGGAEEIETALRPSPPPPVAVASAAPPWLPWVIGGGLVLLLLWQR